MKPMLGTLVALGLGLLGPCTMKDGVDAFHAGEYPRAYQALTRAEERCGVDADARLVFDRALAALQAGDLRAAEFSADKALVRAGLLQGAAFEDLRVFLFANVAVRRSMRAEAEAELIDADPTAFTRAILHVDEAVELWKTLVVGRDRKEWPAARRNLERALKRRADLETRREEAEARQNRKKEQELHEIPEEEPEDAEARPEEQEEKARPQLLAELSPQELARLFEKLEALEKEKRELRGERQRVRSRDVEKDW